MAAPAAPVSVPGVRRLVVPVVAVVVLVTLAGCSTVRSWFGKDGEPSGESVTVFDATVGDCFLAPADIAVEVTSLTRIDCASDHQLELFATPSYVAPGTTTAPDSFPGDAALKSFADGTCAQAFAGYVGVDYRDSSYFFTYLNPSARSWEQDDDRTTLCFVTTTGGAITGSVQGSKQ